MILFWGDLKWPIDVPPGYHGGINCQIRKFIEYLLSQYMGTFGFAKDLKTFELMPSLSTIEIKQNVFN